MQPVRGDWRLLDYYDFNFATFLKGNAAGDPNMNFIDQLDPELRVAVEKLPTDRPMDLNEIPVARVKMKKRG